MGENSQFLMSSNSMFNTGIIESGSIPLDADSLYFYMNKTNTFIELTPPLFVMGATPSSEKNACFFYNKTENKSTEYVSYHYDTDSHKTEEGDKVLSKLRDILIDS